MKNIVKAALAATVVLGATSAAHADLNVNGAVGLPINPTAQIPNRDGVRLQGNYYDHNNSVKEYGLFAAGRVGDNLEINGGINRLSVPGGGGDITSGAIGAKYLITRESDPAGVRLAVGGGVDRIRAHQEYGYLVATKSLGSVSGDRNVVGSLGIRYDHFSLGAATSSQASVYAGAEVPLTAKGVVSFVGEFGSKEVKAGSSVYSAGLRYRPEGQSFSIGAGWQRDGLGGGDDGLFVNLGYSFGTK